jgi:hypothetical protein
MNLLERNPIAAKPSKKFTTENTEKKIKKEMATDEHG